MRRLFVALLSLLSFVIYGCNLDPLEEKDSVTEETWLISDRTEQRKAQQFTFISDAGEIECLVINRRGQYDFYLPVGRVEDFTYERGYSYKIEVFVIRLADPPQDGSSEVYKLKRIIHKQ